jgi:hypothetical protein
MTRWRQPGMLHDFQSREREREAGALSQVEYPAPQLEAFRPPKEKCYRF